MKNFLYIVLNPETKLTKIGISEDVYRRVDQIERGCGQSVQIIAFAEVENFMEMERFLHSVFDHKRCKGEWFDLKEKEIDWLHNFWLNYFPVTGEDEDGKTTWNETKFFPPGVHSIFITQLPNNDKPGEYLIYGAAFKYKYYNEIFSKKSKKAAKKKTKQIEKEIDSFLDNCLEEN